MHDLCEQHWQAAAPRHLDHYCIENPGHGGYHLCACGEFASPWTVANVPIDEDDDEADRLRLRELIQQEQGK